MLIRNSAYNLIGLGAPLLVALWAIPQLITSLGTDRFGLLTLMWAVVSYFGLFDMGLGRALTQQLAVRLGRQEYDEVGPLIGTAVALMAALGVFAGLLMASAATWGIGLLKDVPDKGEAEAAVYAMAVGMPFILLTAGFRGILEARQAFWIINSLRLPLGLFTFLGPLAVVKYGAPRLDWVAWALIGGRAIACVVHAYYAWTIVPESRNRWCWRPELVRPLLVSGGWLTVSSTVSPFMGYVDRFVIGSLVSATAVAYYVTPQELVLKLWIVPGALTSVLFPMFAVQVDRQGSESWETLAQGVRWLFALLFPITLSIALFASELLNLWIGPEFAHHSKPLLQIFAAGILINCLAHVPFTLLQGGGHARTGAFIHCCELPFFVIALVAMTWKFGLVGAALAWASRIVVDAALMFHYGRRAIGESRLILRSPALIGSCALVVIGFSGAFFESLLTRIAWSTFSLAPVALLWMRSARVRNSPQV